MTAGALRYLLARSLRNKALRQVQRLRQPRYAVALLAGVAYLALIFGRNRGRPGQDLSFAGDTVELVAAAGLVLVVAWAWISESRSRVLAYSEAEVMFLFPAPISRRALLGYKLLRAQSVILFSTVLWVLILGGGRGGVAAPLQGIALWCLFTTLHLHRVAAALARSSTLEHGRAGLRRHSVLLLALTAIVLLAGAAAIQAVGLVMAAPPGTPIPDVVRTAFDAPLLRVLLFPFLLLTRPLAAHGTAEWMRTIPWALGLLVVHYAWVIRSDRAFEEAAADASLAEARRLEALRAGTSVPTAGSGRSVPVLALPPIGPPAHAILWKNVTMLLRRRRLRTWTLVVAAAGLAMAYVSALFPSQAKAVGGILLVWGGAFTAMGGLWVRNDLRTDLAHLELLRSYPIDPDALVRMEAMSSAVVVSLVQLALLLVGALAFTSVSAETVPHALRIGLAVGAVLVLPSLNYTGMMMQNGAALLFPGWVRVGPRRGGVEAMGQSMLTALVYVMALAAASIIPGAAAAGAYYLLRPTMGWWVTIPGAAVAAMLLLAEAWILSLWLGTVYEQLDPPSAGVDAA